MALPERPEDPRAGECVYSWPLSSASGWTAGIRLLVPYGTGTARPRPDQYDLEIDGAVVLQCTGLTAIMHYLRTEVFPRQLTRMERYRCDQIAESTCAECCVAVEA